MIFMNGVGAEFLKSQELQSLLWLRYTEDIFFICSNEEEESLR